MAGNFFGGEFFGGGFFGVNESGDTGGKGDNRTFKPTGLLDRPRKPVKEGRKKVSDRVDESAQIQADIAARLAKEFSEETLRLPQGQEAQMTLAEVEYEIGVLMRKALRTQEEELMLVVLMAAAA